MLLQLVRCWVHCLAVRLGCCSVRCLAFLMALMMLLQLVHCLDYCWALKMALMTLLLLVHCLDGCLAL